MGTRSEVKNIEKMVRSSKIYEEWVMRNKAPMCLFCDTEDDLEIHHIVELYHIILGLWKLYSEVNATFKHCLSIHEDDRCDNATLCIKCHQQLHQTPTARKPSTPCRVETWCAIPRMMPFTFRHGTKSVRYGSVGLLAAQTMFGIGWYVLNGHMDDRIIVAHRRRFADLLSKTPGTSFNNGLDNALSALPSVIGHHVTNNDVEIHLSREYLQSLKDNPWFFPLKEVKTSRMSVLSMRWFLSLQSNQKSYRIGMNKLADHLGMETRSPAWIERTVLKSVEDIPWATASIRKEVFEFRLTPQGAVPIHSLREMLTDSLY